MRNAITAHDHFIRNIRMCRDPIQNQHPCCAIRDRRKQRFRPTLGWDIFWDGQNATIISFCDVHIVQNTGEWMGFRVGRIVDHDNPARYS
jgi:hypothetical protein